VLQNASQVTLTFLRDAASELVGEAATLFGKEVVAGVAAAMDQPVSRFQLLGVTTTASTPGTVVALGIQQRAVSGSKKVHANRIAAMRAEVQRYRSAVVGVSVFVSFLILPADATSNNEDGSSSGNTLLAEQLAAQLDSMVRNNDPSLSSQAAFMGLVPAAGAQPVTLQQCADGSFKAECPTAPPPGNGDGNENGEAWYNKYPLIVSIPVVVGAGVIILLAICLACWIRRRRQAKQAITHMQSSGDAYPNSFGEGASGDEQGHTAASSMEMSSLQHNPYSFAAVDQRMQQLQKHPVGGQTEEVANLHTVGAHASDHDTGIEF
jgi:hypothetical protein